MILNEKIIFFLIPNKILIHFFQYDISHNKYSSSFFRLYIFIFIRMTKLI